MCPSSAAIGEKVLVALQVLSTVYWVGEKLISVFRVEKHEKTRNYFFPNPIYTTLYKIGDVEAKE